jgi:hypothetical protein
MPLSRTQPEPRAVASLDAALRSIGMRVGSTPASREPADIEVTVASAVEQALPRDYRLLGVIVAWLEEHHARVNVPRLGRVVKRSAAVGPLVSAFWAAIGHWLGAQDTRWRAFERLYAGKKLDLDDAEITAVQLQRAGADPRFAGSPLRVQAKLLRSRSADVDTSEQLAARHPLYRKRLELGANFRADVWYALERDPEATPAQVARKVGCAYETARLVAEDFRLLQRSRSVA